MAKKVHTAEAEIDTGYIEESKKKKKQTERKNCLSCGAPLVFDPETQALKCAFCSSVLEIEKDTNVEENVLNFSNDRKAWADETHVFKCSSCGAETVLSKNEISKNCVFCGSPAVVEVEDIEGIRPDAVLPFKVTEEQAGGMYKKFLKSKRLAPKKFRFMPLTEPFSALYSPSWAFNSDSQSQYNGVVGDYYYVTVRRGKTTVQERRVRYRNVSGGHADSFSDIRINSGTEIEPKKYQKLQPFPFEHAVVYSPEYLAGHVAEHYSLPLDQGWAGAKAIMDRSIYNAIKASLHCDVVQTLNVRTRFFDMTYRYLLLPVYIHVQKFKKKLYKFFINGATGEVVGDAPLSFGKVSLIALLSLAILGGIAALAWFFMKKS